MYDDDENRIASSDQESDETLHLGGSGKVPVPKSPSQQPDATLGATLKEEDTAPTMASPPPVPHLSTRITNPSGEERYQITREFARGGMGRILLAYDASIGRQIALKETLRSTRLASSTSRRDESQRTADDISIERFIREAKVTGRLEHPNIVPVYEIGERADGRAYYTMRFVPGETLSDKLKAIRNDAALTDDARYAKRIALLDSFVDICNAIAYAHSRGVIHRDLKPQNVIIGEFGETVLIDWGLARVEGQMDHHAADVSASVASVASLSHEDSNLTMEGSVIGTPAYMPPEQAEGRIAEVDERSDVYALGAILYEILGGEVPYRGPSAYAVLQQVLEGPPIPLRAHYAQVPSELVHLVERAMEREPATRLASAAELANDVRAFRDGRTLASYAYSGREHFLRFIRRNKAVVTTLFLAVIALLVLGALAYSNISREKDHALAAQRSAEASEAGTQAALKRATRSEEETKQALGRAEDSEEAATSALGQSELDRKAAEAALAASKASLREAQITRSRAHGREAEAAIKRRAYSDALLQEATAIALSPDAEDRSMLAGLETLTPRLLWQTSVPAVSRLGDTLALDSSGRYLAGVYNQKLMIVDGAENRIVATYGVGELYPSLIQWRTDQSGVVVVGSSGSVIEVDLTKPASTGVLNLGVIGSFDGVALSGDGTTLASVSEKGTLTTFHLGDSCRVLSRRIETGGANSTIAINFDGSKVAFLVKQLEINLADATNLESFKKVREFTQKVWALELSFSPNGDRLASYSDNGAVQVYDLLSESARESPELTMHSFHWLSNDELVDTSTGLRRIDLRKDPIRARAVDLVKPLDTEPSAIRLSADGQRLIMLIAAYDHAPGLLVVDAQSGAFLNDLPKSLPQAVYTMQLSPEGRLAAWAENGTLHLIGVADGAERTYQFADSGYSASLAFSWDGAWLWVAANDELLRLETATLLATKEALPEGFVPTKLALAPDQRSLLAVQQRWDSEQITFGLFDLATKQWRVEARAFPKESIKDLAFDADGHGFKTLTFSGVIQWWNLATLSALAKTWQIPAGALLASNNETYLLSSNGGTLEIGACIEAGSHATRKIASGFSDATNLAVSANMRTAAFWSYQGEIVVVDLLSARTVCRLNLRQSNQTTENQSNLYAVDSYDYASGLADVALTPDGLTMLTASEGGSMRAFDLSTLPISRAAHLHAAQPTIASLQLALRQESEESGPRTPAELGRVLWGPRRSTAFVVPSYYSYEEDAAKTVDLISLVDGEHLQTLCDLAGLNLVGAHRSRDAQHLVVLAMRHDSENSEAGTLIQFRVDFARDGSASVTRTQTPNLSLQSSALLPDGRVLGVTTGLAIVRVTADGAFDEVLPRVEDESYGLTLALSGDGSHFALYREAQTLFYRVSDMRLVGSFRPSDSYQHAPLSYDGSHYFTIESRSICKKRVADDQLAWSVERSLRPDTLTPFDAARIFVANSDGSISLLDIDEGKDLGKIQVPLLESYADFDLSPFGEGLLYGVSGTILTHQLDQQLRARTALESMALASLPDWARLLSGRYLDGFVSKPSVVERTTPLGIASAQFDVLFGAPPKWRAMHQTPAPRDTPADAQAQHEASLAALSQQAQARQRVKEERFESYRFVTSNFGGTPKREQITPRAVDLRSGERSGNAEGSVDYADWWQSQAHGALAVHAAARLRELTEQFTLDTSESVLLWRWLEELLPADSEVKAALADALLAALAKTPTLDEKAALCSEIDSLVAATLPLLEAPVERAKLLRIKAQAAQQTLLEEASLEAYRAALALYADDADALSELLQEVVSMLIGFARPDLARQEMIAHRATLKPAFLEQVLGLLDGFDASFQAMAAGGYTLPRLLVGEVRHLSSASKGGVKGGDFVLTFEGNDVHSAGALESQWQALFGDTQQAGPEFVSLKVMRQGLLVDLRLSSAANHGISGEDVTSREIAHVAALRSQADALFNRADRTPQNDSARAENFSNVLGKYQELKALAQSPYIDMRIGMCHYWLGDFAAADAALSLALEAPGGDPAINRGLTLAFRGYSRGSLEMSVEAIADFEAAIQAGLREGYAYSGALTFAQKGGYYQKGLDLIKAYGDLPWLNLAESVADLMIGLPALHAAQADAPRFPCLIVFVVTEGSEEAKAGLMVGDCFAAVEGIEISTIADFATAWQTARERKLEKVDVTLYRKGEKLTIRYAIQDRHGFNAYQCVQEKVWPEKKD